VAVTWLTRLMLSTPRRKYFNKGSLLQPYFEGFKITGGQKWLSRDQANSDLLIRMGKPPLFRSSQLSGTYLKAYFKKDANPL
jgi:hypothetical protein